MEVTIVGITKESLNNSLNPTVDGCLFLKFTEHLDKISSSDRPEQVMESSSEDLFLILETLLS
jgi:hypothetical protein